ncbi:MAG: hypothetical protein PF503_10495 [Desulfobacula sp.]|jgi:hypothetical protein|nr:hypothetical protein [Desulfobacula sp.]
MRDCIFLLADTNMEAAFKGFLCRDQFHQSLQCGTFDFDMRQDLVVAAGANDPGLYNRGHEILKPYIQTHTHAVLVLDSEWAGSPGAEAIDANISANLYQSGWRKDNCRVIVIEPELESWTWQRNDHVARHLGLASASSFPNAIAKNVWPDGQAKPDHPKETLEAVLRTNRIPRSSSIYKNITSRVSVDGCEDQSFQLLRTTLQAWFPVEGYLS